MLELVPEASLTSPYPAYRFRMMEELRAEEMQKLAEVNAIRQRMRQLAAKNAANAGRQAPRPGRNGQQLRVQNAQGAAIVFPGQPSYAAANARRRRKNWLPEYDYAA